MSPCGDEALGARERESIDRALRADPALAEELRFIAEHLGPAESMAFWSAFARESERAARPAAAVLAALEVAAGVRRN